MLFPNTGVGTSLSMLRFASGFGHREISMTPRERKDMPWIIGAFVALGGLVCGTLIYRLLM